MNKITSFTYCRNKDRQLFDLYDLLMCMVKFSCPTSYKRRTFFTKLLFILFFI